MTALIALCLAPFALLLGVFSIEVFFGLRRGRRHSPPRASLPAATIIIPAQNEEAVIGATVAAMKKAAGGGARILVVADNCNDGTAAEAKKHGAEVIERNDPDHRGKGFALDHARSALQRHPPSVVVIVDADCSIDQASLTELIRAAAASNRPAQAINLLRPAPGASPMVQISTFAFVLKNLVRQRGLQRLANRVHLTGTGMALPWSIFQRCELATASIVEDVKLGLELASQGHPAMLVEAALVMSDPSTASGTLVQRQRWEGGYLAMAREAAPRAVLNSLRSLDGRALWAALDLLIPPLSLLVLLNVLVAAFAALLTAISGASWWPNLVHAALFGCAGLALLAAWHAEGRRFVSARVLARIPLYLMWKVPMYLRLARVGSPRDWLRTGR